MSTEFDARSHVAHMEKVMGLTIEEDWRPVVEAHIAAIEKAAALVQSFPLEEETEAAPVFEA
ncbi:DUF4089 domain-containing protein [Roseibium sp. MMSF_3412]|uniref:DUF4089 domain-containing protein n=1 Tax=unclassified Roseibium TaxID=2629323 RepID=UPI0027400EED|nr:DUF4089 domain-containing protein [Roseibium sp. MMSF_3412]